MLLRGRRTVPVLTTGGNPTDSLKANRRVVKVPKGTSKYQAAWIVDDGEEGSEKDDDDDEDDDMDDDLMEEAVSQVLQELIVQVISRPLLHVLGKFCPSNLLCLCKGMTQSQDLPGFPLLNPLMYHIASLAC